MVQLGEICTKAPSNIAQKDLEKCDGIYPIYGASGLIKHVDFYQQEKPYVAVVKDGAGVGRVMCLPAKSSAIGTMQYIIPNDGVDVHYLAFAIEHMNLAKYYTGATIPHIYFKDYCTEKLPSHSVDEQRQIALLLNRLSNLISLRKQQLAKLDELIKSRFIELFGDGNYPQRTLAEISAVITKGTTPTTAGFQFQADGIKFYKVESISESHSINLDKVAHISQECYDNFKRSQLRTGDILFSIAGAIGRTAIIDDTNLPGNTNQAVAIVRLSPDCNVSRKYLITALGSPIVTEQYNKKKRGIAQINLSLQDIGNLIVPIPNSENQIEFERFVDRVDKSKLTIQRSLDELELLKKTFMQQHFEQTERN